MCGIAGSTRCDLATLRAMGARLAHRGPDGNGVWRAVSDEQTGPGLVHARLAIIDLSPGGAQPMASQDGRYVIVYNGEVFNYRTLKDDLEAAGERFSSQSDTEVLLRLLMREGVEGLARVNGMFALALWDHVTGTLLLARDRLGIKPLVYAPLAGGALAFASEIGALAPHPGIDRSIDRQALSEYLACLYVPAPRTIQAGVRKLEPGHVLQWQDGTFSTRSYWSPVMHGDRRLGREEAVEEILPLLRRAVGECMVADVPVGCFLSGGIDSSVIAALMAEHARDSGASPVRTFTMAFDESAYDERSAAQSVALHIGSQHTELRATAEFADRADHALAAFGEPFGNPTALLIDALAKAARPHVAVALVGDGGDEVFAGYPRYQGGRWAGHYRKIPRFMRRNVIAPAVGLLAESRTGHHWRRRLREFVAGAELPAGAMYASWVEYFTPEERRRLLDCEAEPVRPIARLYAEASSEDVLDAMQETDLRSFLPGNLLAYGDAMSMAHALELRLPMLDYRLIEAVGRLTADVRLSGGAKGLLRAVANRLLPRSITERPKLGFNPPLGVWLAGPVGRTVEETLTPQSVAAAGLAWQPVQALMNEHRAQRRDVALKIWAIYMLVRWRATVA
ncbi:MAG: asparagine synthase (glutamine-hydrolyzing) [Proteobacteria bacterium]|nr:asparagine synthase (glutamine-hydrolyzing) [Pseudomonadota bacterium]